MRAMAVSIRDQALWQLRHQKTAAAALAGLFFGVVALIPGLPNYSLLLIGAVSLAVAIISVAWESSSFNSRSRGAQLAERRPMFPDGIPMEQDLPHRFSTQHGTIVHNPSLNATLHEGWEARFHETEYRLPPDLAEVAPFMLRRTSQGVWTFNGKCVRMLGDCRTAGSKSIPFETAAFFDGLCSNELMRWHIERHGRPWDVRADYMMDRSGFLTPLANSRLANIVGASTLAVTEDAFVLVTRQSTDNHANPGLAAPSGSGSLEPGDAKTDRMPTDRMPLSELIMNGAVREMLQESGIPPERVAGSRLIGFGRWIERGAKPEFFGVTALTGTAAEIERERTPLARRERRFVNTSSWEPLASLRTDDAERDAIASIPLAFGIHILDAALRLDPNTISNLRSGPATASSRNLPRDE